MPDMPQDFVERLATRFPAMKPKLQRFSSGAFMIDVAIREEIYVVEYLPNLGFGVSRQRTAVFGWEGVEVAMSTIEEVEAHLAQLVGSK